MGCNDFLHTFLGLSADIAERHICDLSLKNHIKITPGNAGEFTFLFSFFDQGSFLFRRRTIVKLAVGPEHLALFESQGHGWRGKNKRRRGNKCQHCSATNHEQTPTSPIIKVPRHRFSRTTDTMLRDVQ